MKCIFVFFFVVTSVLLTSARSWQTDILGDSYEHTVVEMPDDYSGEVVASIVRHRGVATKDVAMLYVHGYNDYFFQSQLGDSVLAHGYGFYAVDLRKYGRSLREGQRPFELRNIREYYEDLDSAISVMREDGWTKVVMAAHSTGGLITSCYLSERNIPQVRALVLNSPFLDMNLGGFMEKVAVPVVSVLPFKNISISQGDSNAYAQSLLKRYHGEWDYDTNWKYEISPDVTSGWISAIHKAHRFIHKKADVKVPILLMHSDNSVSGSCWSEAFNHGDAVLDVDDISKYGKRLGDDVTEVTVAGGLHDLILSKPEVRRFVYWRMFAWLESNGF